MQTPESPNPDNRPDLSKGTPPPVPPNNPYEAPGNAANASANMPPSAPTGAPVSTDVIGQSWELLKPQIGMWIVAFLIYIAITGALNGVSVGISAAGGQEPNFVIVALSFLISIVNFVLGLLVSAGLMKMAIHHVRSGQADITKIFEVKDMIGPIIIAGFITAIAAGVGFVLCIIPGIIVALGFSMTTPLIVDQRANAMDAIKRSWETCKPHLGALLVLFLVLGLLNIAGVCACGVGILVTAPMTQLALALTYRNLFGVGRAESGAMPSVYPPPPIATP